VLSSSWRLFYQFAELQFIFERYHIDIMDVSPTDIPDRVATIESSIAEYEDEYIVIDDFDLDFGHLYRTDVATGLTGELVESTFKGED